MAIRTDLRRAVIRGWPALILGTLAPLAGTVPAAAQGVVVQTYGDWQLQCSTPPGAQAEQCSLVQKVRAEDRENIGLDVIVFRTADRQAQLLRVLAPLGVLLPFGLGLRIDETNVGTTEYVRCFYPEGCLAEVIIDDTLLAQLQGGTTANFVIVLTPGEPIGIPVSLNGFTEGFAALP